MLDINQLKQKVKTNTLPAFIAIGGKEKSLQDDIIKYIRTYFLSKSNADLNHIKVDFIDKDFTGLIENLYTMPFLAEKRFAEIHSAEKLSDENLEELKKYFDNPSQSSFLLICFDKFDKRNKVVNFFSKLNVLYEFDELSDKELLNKIILYAKDYDLLIDENIANFLAETLDKDILLIKNFFAKIAPLFSGRISLEKILPFLSESLSLDVFLLVKSISEGNLEKSLFLLNKLRDTKENPIKFLGLLLWQFRVIVHIRHSLDANMSEWDVRKTVGVFADRYEWMSKVAKKNTVEYHIMRLTRLIKVDEALKSINSHDQFMFIEKAIYQSCIGI